MMQTAPADAPTLPAAFITSDFDVEKLITVATRLNALLAEENHLLSAMRLTDLAALQQEKRNLTQQVEAFQRTLAVNTTALQAADPERRDLLLATTQQLVGAIERNLHLTSVAQSVNQRVMQTIVEAVAMQHRVGTYSPQGQTSQELGMALSVNLNERA